jgi:Rrf2 family protein
MAANSRFAVSIHCMLALAYMGESGSNAEVLATSVQTNPVVVRRLLKALEKGGLVEIRQGKGGGVRLRRAPQDITLADIYACESDGQLFSYHGAEANACCPVSCHIKNVLEPVFQAASHSLLATLKQTKLSDLIERLPAR